MAAYSVSRSSFHARSILMFYPGSYEAPPTVRPAVEKIVLTSPSLGEFIETPFLRKGVFLLDVAFSNNFEEVELSVLLARIVDRGYTLIS